jgi:hypothetical protein
MWRRSIQHTIIRQTKKKKEEKILTYPNQLFDDQK